MDTDDVRRKMAELMESPPVFHPHEWAPPTDPTLHRIEATVYGQVWKEAVVKEQRDGTALTQMTVRAPDFITVVSTVPEVMETMATLAIGDTVTLEGVLSLSCWTGKDGNTHPSAFLRAYKARDVLKVKR